jgi:hypothetical protein
MVGRSPGSEPTSKPKTRLEAAPHWGGLSCPCVVVVQGSELSLQSDSEDVDRAVCTGRGLEDDL